MVYHDKMTLMALMALGSNTTSGILYFTLYVKQYSLYRVKP